MLGYSFAGLMGGSGIDGEVLRTGQRWYFKGAGTQYVFDTSADYTPQVGPAVLYGAGAALVAVFQRGRAVGWFRPA